MQTIELISGEFSFVEPSEEMEKVDYYYEHFIITSKLELMGDGSDEESLGVSDTEYLLSIPGMKESIREGMNTPEEELLEDLDW